MKREIPQEELIIKRNRRKRGWRRFVMAMACVVVFFTTYALILPAITMEHSCSLEEHAHGEGCYENETLVCVMEEHRHDIHCEGTKETETLAETESAQTEEIQAETTSATENSETTATTESAETVVEEMVVTETVPQETQVGDIVMEDSGEQGELFIYEPTEEIGRGTYEGRKLKCGQDGAEGHSHTTDCYEPSTLTWVVTKNTLSGEHTLTIHGKGEMPDYTNQNYSTRPWESYAKKISRVILGKDVTHIGAYAFTKIAIKEIVWPYNIESDETLVPAGYALTIGDSAFTDYSKNCLSIPGYIKTIGNCAFSGLDGADIYIHGSVTSIGWNAFGKAKSITVDEENSNYSSEGGILFNKEKTQLVEFPPLLDAHEVYRVPETVTDIGYRAFDDTAFLREIHIPSNVTTFRTEMFRSSNVSEVYFENGTKIHSTGMWFFGAPNISFISFPKDTEFILDRNTFSYNTCPMLESIEFPNGLKYINPLGTGRLFPNLHNVIYDAQSAGIENSNIWGTDAQFDITVGPNVDKLPATFSYFSECAIDFYFVAGNAFEVEAGAFNGAGAPLEGLSGTLYAGENGVLYACDAAKGTAALVYCPPNVASVTVPESIEPETGVEYNVVSVCKDALKCAENLEGITFSDPNKVILLEALAMANCPSLTTVNGYSMEKDAIASFANVKAEDIGYNVFYNTGLRDAPNSGTFAADMNGGQSLTVTADGAANLQITAACDSGMAWKDRGDGTGGYKLLTGERVSLNCGTGSIIENQTAWYRVYLRFTNEEGYAPAPGTEENHGENSWKITYYATEDPYTVCAEFGAPPAGASGGLPIGVYYPHYSRGGGLTVWGVVLEGSPAISGDSEKRPIVESDNVMQFSWSTKANTYDVTKKAASDTALGVSTDSEGVSCPSEDVKWTISVSGTGEAVSDFGKDLVRSVEFRDVMTLPDGISWKEGIKEALVNNDIHYSGGYFYAGDTQVGSLSYNTSTNLSTQNAKASWDKDLKTVVFSWRTRNTSSKEDLNPFTVTLTVLKSALVVDAGDTFSVSSTGTFENTVSAKFHYTYAEDIERESSATRNIGGGAAKIGVSKSSTTVSRFGEDLTYTLKVTNSGALVWSGAEGTVYSLSDTLHVNTYIKPGNMEKMFAENNGTVITISNVVLGAWESVTATNGGEAWKNTSNSDYGTAGNTLTVRYDSDTDKYLIAVKDGAPQTYDHVADGLKDVGYAVTKDATYKCSIPVNEEGAIFTLGGGQSLSYKVYATVKNSFQMFKTDLPNGYGSGSIGVSNYAYLIPEGGKSVANGSCSNSKIYQDATLTKSVTKVDGTALPGSYACNDGDVLDYQLTFAHYGSGSYENLPLVDDLYGSQYLLVPIEENPGLADKNLETHGECYILKVGTYEDVVVGVDDEGKKLIADTVTVTAAGDNATNDQDQSYTGLHTRIKWYFPELPGGNYAMWVKYQALVDLDLTGVSYTIGNVAWMNDRPGSRIYASLWGGGTLIEYEKNIVDQMGEAPAEDKLIEDGYSMVKPGQSVTYRLTLRNPNDYTFTLNGTKLADMLPETFGQFTWEKDVNITGFKVRTEGDVTLKNMDSWELGAEYGGLLDTDRQYILWPDAASVTLPKDGKVYIYFTLTYPEDGGEDTTWDKYAEAVNGNPIDNRLYVYRYPSTVKHDLEETGRVMLQKGVFGTYYYALDSKSVFHPGNSREYYNIADAQNRAVMYYVVILNDANKRLYLSDVYDALPKGFDYLRMTNGSDLNNVPQAQEKTLVTAYGDSNALTQISGDVTYRSATVTATELETGVKFRFSAGNQSNSVHWDEERSQCYLKRNEAIVFGYLCCTNDAKEGTAAVNTAAMAYTDPLGTGMDLALEERTVAAVQTDQFKTNNDGSRYTMTAEEAANAFGVETAETWLTSDVTLHRGGIMPGIQKSVASYTPPSGAGPEPNSVAYENHAPHDATVKWKLLMRNAGTQSMTDYTVTDIMPKPYSLVGNVSCVIKDVWGREVASYDLLKFPEHEPAVGLTLTVTDLILTNNNSKNVTINGASVAMGNDTTRFHVAVSLDENGNEVLTLRMEGRFLSIPEGGSMEISLSSMNPTKNYVYSVFTNQATLMPNQEFTNLAGIGRPERNLQGLIIGARSSAPVTVTSGFATSSVNEVFFGTDKGSSVTPEDTYVVLENAESNFSYTLTVHNDTTRAMTKLVLIDNLPEPNDHTPFDVKTPRGSEFAVSLAQEPNFAVTVNDVLYTGSYQIQYSTGTNFGGPQSEHWKGEESIQWTDNPTGARAIRVILNDTIPADSVVKVSFQVKVDGDVKAGQTAWNSFGYHYALEGEVVELEAMPLAVGVKIPSVPELAKKLVDSKGEPLKAAENTDFTFQVTGPHGSKTFSVTVKDENSISEWLPLDWNWEAGKTYTITEIGVPKPYAFDRFLGVGTKQYTFTYDPAVTQTIICQNVMDHWAIRLTKVDGRDEDTVLEGAEFKLYGLEANTAETKEYEGQTWYLCRSGTTDENGVLEWKELDQAVYLLVETKAPDGYQLPTEPYRVLTQSDTGELEVKVENVATYELPETGGMGREGIFLAGIWLATLAALGLLLRRRRLCA